MGVVEIVKSSSSTALPIISRDFIKSNSLAREVSEVIICAVSSRPGMP